MSDKFEYSYSAPTENERQEIENIRADYAPNVSSHISDLDRLRKLDKKVKTPPLVLSLMLGICGTLIFGIGITFSTEWENLVIGIPVGILGAAIMIANPYIHKIFSRRLKKKYGERILSLADKLLKDDKNG